MSRSTRSLRRPMRLSSLQPRKRSKTIQLGSQYSKVKNVRFYRREKSIRSIGLSTLDAFRCSRTWATCRRDTLSGISAWTAREIGPLLNVIWGKVEQRNATLPLSKKISNQSIDLTINRPNNQSVEQPLNQPINQFIFQYIDSSNGYE